MTSPTSQWPKALGSFGLGTVAAGVALRLFQPERERIWAGLLIAGLLMVVVYLALSWREVASSWGRRSTREGANSATLTLVVAGLLVATNYLADRHNEHWDFTESRQFTLSEQSRQVVGNLDGDVRILLFDQQSGGQAYSDLLTLYDDASDRVSFELIDQEAEPARASAFLTENERSIPFGTVVLQTEGKTERVSSIAVDEQGITNAFIRLLKAERKIIYFLVGHQEKELTDVEASGLSSMRSKLEASNYEMRSLQLLENVEGGRARVPEDASAVVVPGPRSDFLEAEIDALRTYVDSGGNAVVMVDPAIQHGDSQPDALVDWLGELGIVLGEGVIIDASGVGQLFGFGPDVPLVTQYAPFHPVTEDFANVASVFPLVRSVSHDGETTERLTHTAILTTSESSWGETRTEDISAGRVRPDDDEEQGPLNVAIALTLEVAPEETTEGEAPSEAGEAENEEGSGAADADPEAIEPEARVVVVGDSDFIANNLALAPVGNADLFINMINWVAQDEDLIAIRPRAASDRRVFLNQQQQQNVFYLSLLILPGIIVATGISMWYSRRG